MAIPLNASSVSSQEEGHLDEHHTDGSSSSVFDRRKDRWKSINAPKTPPVNLVSATNAPKVNQTSIKQQLPLKLSSLSSLGR